MIIMVLKWVSENGVFPIMVLKWVSENGVFPPNSHVYAIFIPLFLYVYTQIASNSHVFKNIERSTHGFWAPPIFRQTSNLAGSDVGQKHRRRWSYFSL